MFSLRKKRNQVVAILTVAAISTGINAPQAKAFDLFASLAGAFGYGDLYTSATGLYAAGSGLYNDISSLTIDLPSAGNLTKGLLGIQDPNKLYQSVIESITTLPVDPNSPITIDLIAQRIKASVAAKVGSAPLTAEGQKKAIDLAQQNSNLAAASHTAANDTQTAVSSLEAIQKSTIVFDGLTQMIPGLSTQLLQANQTAASGVQIQEQIGKELAAANTRLENKDRQEITQIQISGRFATPLFYPHK